MRVIWIILICLVATSTLENGLRLKKKPHNRKHSKKRKWIYTFGIPWVGILSYKESATAEEAIAGIILIDPNLAIINAHEVASINKEHIKKTTKVMFLTNNGKVRSCVVADYILHPEFDEDTLNTIAVLQLENNRTQFDWAELVWPKPGSRMDRHKGNIYAVGFTDRYKALEQVKYQMEYVDYGHCEWFYLREQLNNKWMSPTHYQCFRRKNCSEQCTFDSGMALVSQFRGKWTLIGMSMLGPGCALPSRFLDFAYYMPWILVVTKPARRLIKESQIHFPNYDKLLLQKINDSSLVLRPYQGGEEVIYGECELKVGEKMYYEKGRFEVPEYGLGLYALSIWDNNYLNITCVTLNMACISHSDHPFSFDYGLMQYDYDLSGISKSIPIMNFGKPVPPKVLHIKEPWLEWWYRPKNAKVATVVFRFTFYKTANLTIQFFGIPIPIGDEEVRDSAVTRRPDDYSRSRRPHRTQLWRGL